MQNSQVHGQVQQARAGRAHSHRTQPQSQLTPAGGSRAEQPARTPTPVEHNHPAHEQATSRVALSLQRHVPRRGEAGHWHQQKPTREVECDAYCDRNGKCGQHLLHDGQQRECGAEAGEHGDGAGHERRGATHRGTANEHRVEDEVAKTQLYVGALVDETGIGSSLLSLPDAAA